MRAIARELEFPGSEIKCPSCARPLVFEPVGWELTDPIDRAGVALHVRAGEMLAYAEATLDLVLGAPIDALKQATPETARALLAFVEGTLSSLPDDSADGRRLLGVRGALFDALEGKACANTTE